MDCSEGCLTAAVMFGVPGVRVLAAQREPAGLHLPVLARQRAAAFSWPASACAGQRCTPGLDRQGAAASVPRRAARGRRAAGHRPLPRPGGGRWRGPPRPAALRDQIRSRLDRFYRLAAHADVPELTRLATTVETWWPAIEAYLRLRITDARTEGCNRKIKQLKRVACGVKARPATDLARRRSGCCLRFPVRVRRTRPRCLLDVGATSGDRIGRSTERS